MQQPAPGGQLMGRRGVRQEKAFLMTRNWAALGCTARALRSLVKSNPKSYCVTAWRHRRKCVCENERQRETVTAWVRIQAQIAGAFCPSDPPPLLMSHISSWPTGITVRLENQLWLRLRPSPEPTFMEASCIHAGHSKATPTCVQTGWSGSIVVGGRAKESVLILHTP